MSGWDLLGWCVAIGIGVPVALFGIILAAGVVGLVWLGGSKKKPPVKEGTDR